MNRWVTTAFLMACLAGTGAASGKPGEASATTNGDLRCATSHLHPIDRSGISARIQLEDDGETLFVAGTAEGLEPGATYLTLLYDNGSRPGGPNACEPTIFDPDAPGFLLDRMIVGAWQIDEQGHGTLTATNTNSGADYVSIGEIGAASLHRVLGPPPTPGAPPSTDLEACGRVAIDDGERGNARHSARIIGGCLRIVGTNAGSSLAIRLDPTNLQIIQIDVGDDGSAEFRFNRNEFDCIKIFARGGDDVVRIDETVGAITTTEVTTIDGGNGDDKLLGGSGPETFIGGAGDDFIDGQGGSDVAFMGSGNDAFQWDPGDGSDIVEGQDGMDAMLFNGSGVAERFDLSASGERLLFIRNVGNITMDCDDVEQIDLFALGSADTVVVKSLAGTDVVEVNVDLAAVPGGETGDAQPDHVVVDATDGIDHVGVSGSGTRASVRGLAALVNITASDGGHDRLSVNTLAGDDDIQAGGLAFGVLAVLTLNGGPGDDLLTGSGGVDVLNGDDGNDTITGGGDDDVVHLGTGNDLFVWNPGDATDTVDGQEGDDTVEVNGGDGSEDFTITADGTRVRLDRISISPAPFFVDIGTSEHLLLNANGGRDTLGCSGDLAALIQIRADGGPGEDQLLGGNGTDLLLGGDDDDFIDGQGGSDAAFMGAGNDVFQWDPGDGSDVVEGQDGTDTMLFNGSNQAELFDLSASGERLLFTRSVGNIRMDCDGVEHVDLLALGGADTVVVKSLAGTDVVGVNIDLAGVSGDITGDAQPDDLIINGTESPDTIDVSADPGVIVVAGLSASVRIVSPEPRTDLLVVNGLGGADDISAEPEVGDFIILQIVNP